MAVEGIKSRDSGWERRDGDGKREGQLKSKSSGGHPTRNEEPESYRRGTGAHQFPRTLQIQEPSSLLLPNLNEFWRNQLRESFSFRPPLSAPCPLLSYHPLPDQSVPSEESPARPARRGDKDAEGKEGTKGGRWRRRDGQPRSLWFRSFDPNRREQSTETLTQP